MSKPKTSVPKCLEFNQFWLFIAHQLGSSRLKINAQAHDIHDFLDPSNDSREYLKSTIKESYKRSHCDNLQSAISLNKVLDILGETAYELRNNQRDDLFDIELLEEIAWHISGRYKHYLLIEPEEKRTPRKGQVLSFPNYKIRIANSRL